MLKKFFSVVVAILMATTVYASDDASDASAFLKDKLDAVMAVLQTADLPGPDKREKVTAIIMPVFNFPLMARLVVGKTHWEGFSDTQKELFTEAFSQRLQEMYISTVMTYTDEKIIFGPATQDGSKVDVPIDLISGNDKYNILYKMYNSKGVWTIFDAEIKGVSIVKSYRAQIHHILMSGTFDDLMEKIKSADNTNG